MPTQPPVDHITRQHEGSLPDNFRDRRPTLSCKLRRQLSAELDFTSSDYTVIFALVQAGLGVSLVPRLSLESMSTDIQLREIAEPELSRIVSVAVRTGSRRNPPIATVLRALREVTADVAGFSDAL